MDFYTALAAEVLGKPYALVTPNERERAKKYWYARLYDNHTNLQYTNTFTFNTCADAYAFMAAITYKHADGRDKLPRSDANMLVLLYDFDNPHDAYVSLCEAHSSNVPFVSVDCKTEMPK